MKYFIIILIVVIACLYYLYTKVQEKRNQKQKEHFIKQNIWKIVPVNKVDAIKIYKGFLKTDYVKNLSKYDIQSKTNNVNSKLKIEYINYAIEQFLNWTPREIIILQNYYKKFIDRLIELNIINKWMNMPKTVNIIKSTMKHEGEARGYTIKNNVFIKELDYDLFVHELFHVFSRYNPKISENMYKVFKIWVADEIIYPNNSLKDQLISNPDTPQIVFTQIIFNNKEELVTPILHSKKQYNENTKSFFNDMTVSLMFVELRTYNNNVIIIFKDMKQYGVPNYIIPIEKIKEYTNKLGNNTDYNIHPEEVSAKHFEFLINGSWKDKPQPELIQKFYNLMK